MVTIKTGWNAKYARNMLGQGRTRMLTLKAQLPDAVGLDHALAQ